MRVALTTTLARPGRWRRPAEAGLALLVGIGLGLAVVGLSPLLLGLALLTGLGLALLLRWAGSGLPLVIAIITLFPFGVLPVPLGPVRLTFLDLALTALLVVVLLRLLRRDERLVITPPGVGLLGLIGVAVTAYVLGSGYGESAETLRLFLKLLNSLLFYFTVVNLVRSAADLERLLLFFVATAALAAVIGLGLYLLPNETSARLLGLLRPFGYPPAAQALRFIAGTQTERAIGTSIDPNVFGAMLALAGAVAVALLLDPSYRRFRLWLLGALGAILPCLLLTFSRGSWLGLVGGMLFLATLRDRRLWGLFGLFGLLFVTGTVREERFLEHLESGLAARDRAAAMRLGEIKDALRLISQYPWFGVGFEKAPNVDLYIGVSNVYLMIAEQMGLIGLVVFLAVVLLVFLPSLPALRAAPDPRLRALGLASLAGLTAALTAGLFDHHFFNIRFPHAAALFWLLAATAVTAARLASADSRPSTENP